MSDNTAHIYELPNDGRLIVIPETNEQFVVRDNKVLKGNYSPEQISELTPSIFDSAIYSQVSNATDAANVPTYERLVGLKSLVAEKAEDMDN